MTAPTMATGRSAGRPDRSRSNRDVYDRVTASIVGALESGTVPWQRPFTGARLSSPANAITRRPYHGLNVLGLMCEAWGKGYTSSHWLTFQQARTNGVIVRRGEKLTPVVFMKRLSVTRKQDGETSEPASVLLARMYYVANLDQLADLEPGSGKLAALRDRCGESVQRGPEWSPVEECERVVVETGARIVPGPAAGYVLLLDHIEMPPRESFPNGAMAYYPTLFHELAHWTGHPSRLDRDKSGKFGSPVYAFEELVAELGAAFLSQRAGLDHVTQASAYLASWLRVLTDDATAIVRAARLAQQAADLIWPSEDDDTDPGDDAGALASLAGGLAA